ncbi:ParB/RepB/Spo0J family partition protein [Anaerofustis stercorihominis]|uniref:ParB/RepB/Spo0J family partition protein n=1 Tax=Anaerofustis stercorihominis TaxID=214853 RepID=UPI001FA8FF92|nr:ParB/RepB/Spo0J family partition protein [Anaerofustis stercorihominis]
MANVKKVKEIDITLISANKDQPRKYFDEESIKELSESIKSLGIIQPITVRQKGFNAYEVVSGERRLRASRLAGLSKIPCIIVSINSEENDLIALIENIQRENLNFYEEALSYKKIMSEYGMSQEELAGRIGKKQSTISNLVRLLNLDEEVLQIIIENNLTQRHARCLLSLPDSNMRLKAAKEIAKKDLNVKNSELLVERLKQEVVINSSKTNVKNIFNYKIYTNTIKQAYKSIFNTGLECDYKEKDFDDRIEVVITIPKK